jgi:microcystin-dependent protein
MGNLSITNFPVGFVFPVINSNAVPAGALECNGALLAQTTYANLYTGHPLSLGAQYGAGGGTFYLPDFRGRVPRGWSHGSGRDPDAGSRYADNFVPTGDNVGSMQNDMFASHTHGISDADDDTEAGDGDNEVKASAAIQSLPAGGNETRGKNFNVMWCIKY